MNLVGAGTGMRVRGVSPADTRPNRPGLGRTLREPKRKPSHLLSTVWTARRPGPATWLDALARNLAGQLSGVPSRDSQHCPGATALLVYGGVFHRGGRAAPLTHASHVTVGNAGRPIVSSQRLT